MSENEVPRLTPTQRLHEVTMQALSRSPRNAVESVEISRNAKGDTQWTIKAETHEGETLTEAAARAQTLHDDLATAYPRSEPSDADEKAKQLGNAARIHASRARKAAR